MTPALLALFALPALAGEVQVTTATPVIVRVDGQVLEYPEGSLTVTAAGLSAGAHAVEVTNLSGRALGSVRVHVPADQRVKLEFREQQLTVMGNEPLRPPPPPGVQARVGPAGAAVQVQDPAGASLSVSVSVDDDMMSQLAALGYVDAPPPPPPRPALLPMAPQPFARLKEAVAEEAFSDDKLQLLRSAAAGNWFTCAQLGALLDEFNFADDRVEAARILRPRILDPENAFTLNNHLTFSDEKEQVQGMFR